MKRNNDIEVYRGAGERIYLARVMRGYTREVLAELADITPKFLYEIETGKKGFSAIVLYNLCDSLKVDCNYILTGMQQITYDQQLAMSIQMFEKDKTEQIAQLLQDIHELIK